MKGVYILNFFDNIPPSTSVSPISKELYLKNDSNIAVLILHGYTGSPHDMYYIGRQIHKSGFSIYIPRLPGHGTNSNDFLNSNWRDWLRKSIDSYINLKTYHEKVYILGLSMGGVIATLLASKFHPEKIVLAAPALKAKDWRINLTPFFGLIVKKIKRKNPQTFDDEKLAYLASQYWNYDWPSKAADLYKLQKMALKNLSKVTSNTYVILSKKDEAVPFSVKEIIENNIKGKTEFLILEESGHVVVNDIEKEKVAEQTINWLKKE
ncbi:esterase [Petrotoga sp. HKA.pet.4.5]|jgi:carboxylesterase|nr:esterase [Petrotoga sp. Shatin.DS.tank11.9.2.9.3]RLL90655.1 esterase [Petrotoga sp. HKA.pet.4.5]